MNNLKRKINYMLRVILVVMTMMITTMPAYAAIEDGLNVHYLNVGQGDCMVVEYKGRYMLIDGGYGSDIKGEKVYTGFSNAKEWIRNEGIEKFDYVIVTHYDSDHMKGLKQILNCGPNGRIEVGQFIARKYSDAKLASLEAAYNYDSTACGQFANYQSFMDIVKSYATDSYNNIKESNKWKFYSETSKPLIFNNDIELTFVNKSTSFVPANVESYDKEPIVGYKEDVNDDSLAFVMKYKNVKYLFLGDLKKDGLDYAIKTLKEKGISTTNCVMKVPHHGIFSQATLPTNTSGFKALKPSVAIFSTNSYYDTTHTKNIHSILRNASGQSFVDGQDEFYTFRTKYGYCVSTSGNAFNIYAENDLYSSFADSKKGFVKNIKFYQ